MNTSTGTVGTSVTDPNSLNLDPDSEFCPNFDPYPETTKFKSFDPDPNPQCF